MAECTLDCALITYTQVTCIYCTLQRLCTHHLHPVFLPGLCVFRLLLSLYNFAFYRLWALALNCHPHIIFIPTTLHPSVPHSCCIWRVVCGVLLPCRTICLLRSQYLIHLSSDSAVLAPLCCWTLHLSFSKVSRQSLASILSYPHFYPTPSSAVTSWTVTFVGIFRVIRRSDPFRIRPSHL